MIIYMVRNCTGLIKIIIILTLLGYNSNTGINQASSLQCGT